jgi:hypothetical protein
MERLESLLVVAAAAAVLQGVRLALMPFRVAQEELALLAAAVLVAAALGATSTEQSRLLELLAMALTAPIYHQAVAAAAVSQLLATLVQTTMLQLSLSKVVLAAMATLGG